MSRAQAESQPCSVKRCCCAFKSGVPWIPINGQPLLCSVSQWAHCDSSRTTSLLDEFQILMPNSEVEYAWLWLALICFAPKLKLLTPANQNVEPIFQRVDKCNAQQEPDWPKHNFDGVETFKEESPWDWSSSALHMHHMAESADYPLLFQEDQKGIQDAFPKCRMFKCSNVTVFSNKVQTNWKPQVYKNLWKHNVLKPENNRSLMGAVSCLNFHLRIIFAGSRPHTILITQVTTAQSFLSIER